MASNFGRLLRGHRLAANLTQEALAEAARVSTAAIGAYERGIHAAPHRETVALLADALQLNGPARNEFEVAARRKRRPREAEPPADVSRVDNIPVPLTSFFGREADTAQIEEMLRRNRLVTLTGTGGIGKTRLALHVAARLKTTYRDGASFIDFASASDEKLVGSSFASALGISVPSHTDSAMLSTLIGRQSKLLIFDNCEHLLDGVGVLVSAVLNAAPNVTVLATSRERLVSQEKPSIGSRHCRFRPTKALRTRRTSQGSNFFSTGLRKAASCRWVRRRERTSLWRFASGSKAYH